MTITVAFIGIPLLINYLGNIIAIKTEANFGDWLGFWGSYLGGFITLVGVYLSFKLDERIKLKEILYSNRYDTESIEHFVQELSVQLTHFEKGEFINSDIFNNLYKRIFIFYDDNKSLHPYLTRKVKRILQELALFTSTIESIETFNKLIKENKSTQYERNLKELQQELPKRLENVKKENDELHKLLKDFLST